MIKNIIRKLAKLFNVDKKHIWYVFISLLLYILFIVLVYTLYAGVALFSIVLFCIVGTVILVDNEIKDTIVKKFYCGVAIIYIAINCILLASILGNM